MLVGNIDFNGFNLFIKIQRVRQVPSIRVWWDIFQKYPISWLSNLHSRVVASIQLMRCLYTGSVVCNFGFPSDHQWAIVITRPGVQV